MPTYNTFTGLSEFPYLCVKHMMEQSELIWRLLAYNNEGAWREDVDHPNLTDAEKGNLIYDGKKNQNDCRVFLTTGMDDAFVVESTQLRISIANIYPSNIYLSNVVVAMEIYPHFKVTHLDCYKSRQDMILEELLRIFNGQEIGLLGRLYFDRRNVNCTVRVWGTAPFVGKVLTMSNWISS